MGFMPRDGSATRERILSTAQTLVVDNGFRATSVDSVIAASGTSKGSFFHHFASKRELADALIERYAASDLAMLDAGLAAAREAGSDPVERAVAFLRFYEDGADELMSQTSGCLYTSALTELELIEDGATDPIAKAVERWREGYAALLREAVDERADVDTDSLSDHVFVTFEGTYLLARTTGDPGQMRRQLRVLRQLVEAILRR